MQEMNDLKITSKQKLIKDLVSMSLAFHNLNKLVEQKLGLSLVQFHFLNTLRDMPASSPLQLAKALSMHPSTLTQSLKRLQKKGFIFVGDAPKDSRKKILSLTKEGNLALEAFETQIEGYLKNQRHYHQLIPRLGRSEII